MTEIFTLGGSEGAAALGLSPYMTPYQLWAQKTGREAREDISDKEHIIWGQVLEDVVAKEFGRRNNRAVLPSPGRLAHPDYVWITGTPDRLLDGDEGLEVKTASLRTGKSWGSDGTDEIPVHYLIQCMHYIMVTGYQRWHLAVLIGGNDYRNYVIHRNDVLIERMMHGYREFKRAIDSDTPPSPKSSDDCDAIWSLATDDEPLEATESLVSEYRTLCELIERHREIEALIDDQRTVLKTALGSKSTLRTHSGEVLVTWKSRKATRLDTTALKQKYPQIAAEFTREHTSRFFVVRK